MIILLSGRARWITQLVGWTLVARLFFSLISGLRGPGEALARTVVNMLFLLVLFYGNAKWLVNRFMEKGRYRPLVAQALVFWLGMSLLRTWTELHVFGGGLLDGRLPPDNGRRLLLMYTLSYFLLLLFSTLYQLLENRYVLELRHRELEVRHVEAQLNYLKAQINPHFLFNTLNNIYAAALLQHPNTPQMVLRLSDLLRYLTYEGQAAQVPLIKEIHQIQAYFDLFQLKSDRPLQLTSDLPFDSRGWQIEPVLLLPLVENALKHGDVEEQPDGFVRVSLYCAPESLLFIIENSFNPSDEQKDRAGGVGLENIRRRLELNYPGRHRFSAVARDRVFVVQLELHAA
ncbi:MAG: histidine kinase [Saprospiraceae bacterium]|nr:histidine kinase [Saprospiraceae bacterium]